MSVLAIGLYENAKSSLSGMIFLPSGGGQGAGRTANWGAAVLIAATVRG